MPDPTPTEPMNSEELRDLAVALADQGGDAADALEAYEDAPPPKDKTDVCQALQDYKEALQDMIAALNATMADLGCGQ